MKRLPYEPLTRSMGAILAEAVRIQLEDMDFDLVAPIPMHWTRRLRRGTHPAKVLATAVSRGINLPSVSWLIRCRRKSMKQGTLRPGDRFRNIRGAFRISSGYDITDKSVLLVDDIMTTGATANEAARILRAAGARLVAVAVVARAIGEQS